MLRSFYINIIYFMFQVDIVRMNKMKDRANCVYNDNDGDAML